MSLDGRFNYHVAVVGAGPAGLFAARELADQGVHVVLFNRDIKPGGLAEYGIYPTKLKMKEGLRNQFHQILNTELIDYYGNVLIGEEGDLTLNDLHMMGFHAILVSVGAQSTQWLGLPGEELKGVYHAKDIVYHYNLLPPFSEHTYQIGKRVAVVGVGNVMTDIAHWLIEDKQVEQVIAVARRGPAEVKFDRKELENVVNYIQMDTLYAELKRVTPVMQGLNQDPVMFSAMIRGVAAKAPPRQNDTEFSLRFLASPVRMVGNELGEVVGLEVEENTLEAGQSGELRARGTGVYSTLPVDTVIFAIGDQVDGRLGLPVTNGEFAKNPAPRFPIDGMSYEAFDPQRMKPIEGIFLAGWARKPSTGLVGIARKDGVSAARTVLEYLEEVALENAAPESAGIANLASSEDGVTRQVEQCLADLNKPLVSKSELFRLEVLEREVAQSQHLAAFKYSTNQQMLEALEQRL